MPFVTRYFLTICLSIWINNIHAKDFGQFVNENWRWRRFTSADGISAGSNKTFYETKDGVIWMANGNSVSFYNHYIWQRFNLNTQSNFSANTSIKSTFYESANGQLFLLSGNELFELYPGKSRKVYYTQNNEQINIAGFAFFNGRLPLILSYAEKQNSYQLLLKRRSGYTLIWEETSMQENMPIGIFSIDQTHVLFYFNNELFIINADGILENLNVKFNYTFQIQCVQYVIGKGYFLSLIDQSSNSHLVCIGNNGTMQEINLSNDAGRVESISCDSEGNSIFLSSNGKTYIWLKNNIGPTEFTSRNHSYHTAYFSKNGNLWLSDINVVDFFNANIQMTRPVPNSQEFNFNQLYKSAFTPSIIAVGENEVVSYSSINFKQEYHVLTPAKQLKLIRENKNKIWFLNEVDKRELYVLQNNSWKNISLKNFITPNESVVHYSTINHSNDIYFYLNNKQTLTSRLIKYNLELNQVSNISLPNKFAMESLFADSEANVWAIFQKTLFQYKQNKWNEYRFTNNSFKKHLLRIIPSNNHSIFVLSDLNAIGIINNDSNYFVNVPNTWNLATQNAFVSNDQVKWFSGDSYLKAIYKNQLYIIGNEVGIPSFKVQSVVASEPYVWYLQNSKLYVFSPSSILPQNKNHITITPYYSHSGILIHWNVSSYNEIIPRENFQLQYAIDDENWTHPITSTSFFIPDLSKGSHRLSYRILSPIPSLQNDNIYTLELNIPSPYYLLPQFILPVSTLLISLGIAFMLYIMNKRKYASRLKEKDHHLEKLIDLMPVIPFIINPKGIIQEVFIDSIELPQQLPLYPDLNLLDLIPRNNFENVISTIKKCEDRVSDEHLEIEIGGKIFEFTFAPYDEDRSKVKLIAVFAVDISEKKYNELELIRARQIAENADKAKMVFLTNMSHEIRTPMNAILGLTDIMLEENVPDSLKENLTIIKRSADNLLVIINDILDFSKIEAGKIELEKIEFDLLDVIANVFKTFQFKAEQKGLTFYKDVENGIPRYLIGDPYRLNQVLVNLLGNALKFTSKGYVKLVVKKANENPDDNSIRFIIIDTGIGISSAKMDKIFESFTQESSMITRKYGGTGLGLTISKKLVELQGGKINVISELGKGSTFSFDIPFEVHNNFSLFKTNTSSRRELNGIRILVVEDNQMNQVVARQILSRWEALVHTANNGVEAIEILSAREYDIVLMDLQMPDMDGFEATRIIRNPTSEVLNHHIPIIALTADAFPEVKKKAIMVGMNDFVIKPFKQNELFVKIAKYVYQLD